MPARVGDHLDWSTLRLEPGSFVGPDGSELRTDLLFSARLGEERAYLYLLFEHQSSIDRWMPLRMLSYMCRIWMRARDEDGAKALPPIIPVVLHHGTSGWTGPRRFRELIDVPRALHKPLERFIPDLELLIDDLAQVSKLEILERPMGPTGKLTVWAMRAIRVGADDAGYDPWRAQLELAHTKQSREALEQSSVIFCRYPVELSCSRIS